MLYLSSRSKTDSFTAHRTLCADRAPDGGVFVPYKIPVFSEEQVRDLTKDSFCQTVASVLNLFFAARLTAWDVEICASRSPVRIHETGHRLLVAEYFHNPKREYKYFEYNLYCKLAGSSAAQRPTPWAKIAIRIATLFGLHNLIPASVRHSYDISVNTDDFAMPMAAWYAREMGLPIKTIICCCNGSGASWDLIQKGEISAAELRTAADNWPQQIECLIFHTLGVEDTISFAEACERKGIYRISGEKHAAFNSGLYATVIGDDRVAGLIRSIHGANNYFLTDRAAIAFGGLQDYRSRSGENRHTLVLMDSSPTLQAKEIAAAIGVTERKILETF